MKNFFILFFLSFLSQQAYSQITNTDIVAEIKVETTENGSTLTARTINKTDLYHSLKFVFSVIRYDSKNNSNRESVEDLFSLDPFESKDLYKATLVTEGQNKIIILLLVYNDYNKLVGKNRVVFNDEDKTKTIKLPEKEYGITGIVVDETKTKMGKDFFDKFYFYYTYNNLEGKQVVKIDEMYTFRRTTKIMVSVEEEVIFEFFAKPNEEYVEEMAKYSLQRVYQYFQKKEKEKSYISQY